MRSLLCSVPFLLGLTASASDPSALLATTRQAWPENAAFAMVCDYGRNRDAVQAAATAATANGFRTLIVVDVHRIENVGPALGFLASHGTRFVLMAPHDRVAGDGTPGGTMLIHGLDSYNIPACSTRRIALDQGALIAQGDDTGGELLMNSKLKNTFQYQILPSNLKPTTTSRLIRPAEIQVVSFR
jgi:hypothetical protein